MSPIKISPSSPFIDRTAPVDARKRKGTPSRKPSEKPNTPGENVDLSPAARELSDAHEVDPVAAGARSRYLADIKKQIEQGTYEVKGRAIAEKLFKALLKDRGSLK